MGSGEESVLHSMERNQIHLLHGAECAEGSGGCFPLLVRHGLGYGMDEREDFLRQHLEQYQDVFLWNPEWDKDRSGYRMDSNLHLAFQCLDRDKDDGDNRVECYKNVLLQYADRNQNDLHNRMDGHQDLALHGMDGN